jgi:hypothetical protein
MAEVQNGQIPPDEVFDYYNARVKKLNKTSPKNQNKYFMDMIEELLQKQDLPSLLSVFKVFVNTYPFDIEVNVELQQYLSERWEDKDVTTVLQLIGVLTKKQKVYSSEKGKEVTKALLPTTRKDEELYDKYRESIGFETVSKEEEEEENEIDDSVLEPSSSASDGSTEVAEDVEEIDLDTNDEDDF